MLRSVPLFPLPNVVLFPRAVLPLHIFEPRYRQMVSDALMGQGRIAMALLKGDWQHGYHSSAAPIHDVVCVGKILTHELLTDGRYNLLLQGERRARVAAEDRSRSYRRADLLPIAAVETFDSMVADARQELIDTVYGSKLINTTLGRELGRLFDSPLSTAEVADICAFNLLDDVDLKQSLLEETDAGRRIRQVVDAIRQAHPPARARRSAPSAADLN